MAERQCKQCVVPRVFQLFSFASTDLIVCLLPQSFSGTIPDIARLGLLETAFLHNNNLSGPIPSGVFQQLSHLGKPFSSSRRSHPSQLQTIANDIMRRGQIACRKEYLKIQNNHLFGILGSGVCRLKHLANLNYLAADCQSLVDCECCDKCY